MPPRRGRWGIRRGVPGGPVRADDDSGLQTAQHIIHDLENWHDREPFKTKLWWLWFSTNLWLVVGAVLVVLHYQYGFGSMDIWFFLTYVCLMLFLTTLSLASLKAQALEQARDEESAALLNDEVVRYLSTHSDGVVATGLPVSDPELPEIPFYTVVINSHEYDSTVPNSSPVEAVPKEKKTGETDIEAGLDAPQETPQGGGGGNSTVSEEVETGCCG